MSDFINIAIDGPAGAGKSTIAKLVAKKLNCIYVDTGAMYRAMGLYFLRNSIKADDEAELKRASGEADISIVFKDGAQRVLLNSEDVTELIRSEEVGNMASAVSVYGFIRERLVALQREIAACNDVVMDGRDIGTHVLKNAPVKVYLTAAVHTRALRRFKELEEKGIHKELDKIEADIEERDYRDMHRENSPLSKADDAVLIDSSDMSIDEVVEAISAIAKEK